LIPRGRTALLDAETGARAKAFVKLKTIINSFMKLKVTFIKNAKFFDFSRITGAPVLSWSYRPPQGQARCNAQALRRSGERRAISA
jgi:hypothetical protein